MKNDNFFNDNSRRNLYYLLLYKERVFKIN